MLNKLQSNGRSMPEDPTNPDFHVDQKVWKVSDSLTLNLYGGHQCDLSWLALPSVAPFHLHHLAGKAGRGSASL